MTRGSPTDDTVSGVSTPPPPQLPPAQDPFAPKPDPTPGPQSPPPGPPFGPQSPPPYPTTSFPYPPQPPVAYGPPVVAYPGYGVDPVTGLPLSDKSKVVAGLLQLLLGFFLCLGGIGRLYAGHTGLGAAQLVISLVAWVALICGAWLIFPLVVFFGAWLWFVIDGIVLLVGQPRDGYGRLLRP